MRRILFILVTLGLLGFGAALPGFPQAAKPKAESKIDGALVALMRQSTARSQSSAIQTARALGVPFDGSTVTVNLVFSHASVPGLSDALVQVFGSTSVVASQSQTFVRLRLPLNLLSLLEQLVRLVPQIAYVRPPLEPQTLTTSEGVNLIGASALHAAGALGQGTRVAIIDLGFAGLASAQARGELPGNVITRDFSGSGLEFGTSHGTGVAEIVHDVAPNAQLYLYKIGDEVDLENAVSEAIAQGVDVINHAVGWFNTSYYDGTGPIVAITQRATAAGILWVNSAGNYARRHYQGLFRDADADGWMEFAGGDETLDLAANAGDVVQLYLTWRDWPLTAQDYDLVLTDAQGNVVAVSDKTQNGGQEPTEFLRYFVPVGGTYRIQVQAFNAPAPKEIKLFSLFHDLEHAVAQSSLVVPADASNVLTVAAIRRENWTAGPQAPYSSQGPTTDGRPKPDLAGPDNVQTFTLGVFEGTSAAAPHVAGAAALLLSQNPGASAAQISARLRADAVPVGSPLTTGSGRVRLTAPAVQRPDLQIARFLIPSAPRVGESLRYTITVRNAGAAAAGSFLVRLQDRNGSEQRDVSGLAAGSSVEVVFDRTLTAELDTVQVTVDPDDRVAESNEENNVVQFTVRGQAPQLPDLVLESLDFSPASPAPGTTLQWTVRVRNQGAGPAGAFQVQLASASGTRTQTVGSLGPGASAQLSFSLSFLSDGQRFTATADPSDQVPEADETNNARTVTVRAASQQAPPRGQIWVDRARYQVGENLQIHFSLDSRAYAIIYDVDPAGRVSQVFPNLFSRDNSLEAGTYTLPDGPYRFTIQGPAGPESLHLVLSRRPVNPGLDGTVNPAWTDPAAFAAELQARLGAQLAAQDWSTTFTTFQVGASQPANRPPTAAFTFSPSQPLPGQAVSFDGSASSDPDGFINQYRWDFNGDGFVDATGVRVTTSFAQPGAFSVTLTVVDDDGASASTSQTVQVRAPEANRPPVARFTFSPSQPVVGQTVVFDGSTSEDPDGTIVQYRWDLNSDGFLDATGVRVSARFNTARNFSVTLTVIDDDGASASTTQTVRVVQPQVNQPPQARFAFSPASPEVGQTVQFDGSASQDPDGTLVAYRWDFESDGHVDATGRTVTFAFARAGTFRVTLTVVDDDGASASTSQTVQVRSPGGGGSSPAGPGVYLASTQAEKLTLVIQGDPSWAGKRKFAITLLLPPPAQIHVDDETLAGEVTLEETRPDHRLLHKSIVTLSGEIGGDGRAEVQLRTKKAFAYLEVSVQFDLDGDRRMERVPEAVFLQVGERLVHPSLNPFRLRGTILPFQEGATLICPPGSTSTSGCEPL